MRCNPDGDERGEALHELQRFQDDMRGAIEVKCLQREYHRSGLIEGKALVGNCGPGDVPTEMLRPRRAKQGHSLALALERMALIDGEPHFGMPP